MIGIVFLSITGSVGACGIVYKLYKKYRYKKKRKYGFSDGKYKYLTEDLVVTYLPN